MEGGGFFPVLLPALLGLAVAVALRLRMERREAHAAQLATARLETELLKKNLQPHFLLNTLTALSEVVEQDPPGAVRLINDLAGEFRSLTRMSGEKRVSLGQELDLCRAHLRVMSVRTKVAWSLDAAGVDESAPVPPAMFLTLIENGFAHQRVAGAAGVFVLRMTPLPAGAVRYTFLSPGEVRTEPARAPGGTGLRYVRARLEESFPTAWTLTQRAVEEGWETVVELRTTADEKSGRPA
jgi:LytS/YehU family sensor histidine kinase